MRKFAGVLTLAALAAIGVSFSQDSERISVSREDPQGDRRAIIQKNLSLTESESAAFWPLYEKYRAGMRDVDGKRVALIQEFAENYQALGDEKALEMLNAYFEFRKAKVDLQTSYVAKFSKILSAKKVMRYYQVENLIDTMVDFDLTRAIPLIK
jgi:hypothetical protein